MLRNGCRRWQEIIAASRLVVLASFISLAGLSPSLVQARGSETSGQIENIALTQLPPQARDMMTLIYRGGPFQYDKDGAVFGNRERILPSKNRGYYREYTVRTPNERTRGARRIICGGVKPAAPEACYYTDDHYASFRRIVS
ncbi:MAG: ribonuclease [Pseudomonadota bacterium]